MKDPWVFRQPSKEAPKVIEDQERRRKSYEWGEEVPAV